MNHPGMELQKRMDASGMSRKELSLRTGVTEKHICTVLNGSKNISSSFADKLGYVFEDTKYWLTLQAGYDQEQMRLKDENGITENEIKAASHLREISDYFVQQNYLEKVTGKAQQVMRLRELLQVSNLTAIPDISYHAAYRAQVSSNILVDSYVLFAWQRLCEKETEEILNSMDRKLDTTLLQKNLTQIKQQMSCLQNGNYTELQELFRSCGIAFCVVKNFRGAPVQGFIKQANGDKLILCVTLRQKRADIFWFTLFHEIAHILYGDYRMRFVDFDSVSGDAENRADQFARDQLLDPKAYQRFVWQNPTYSWNCITDFASQNDVEPFIVLGRLQKDRFLDWTDYANQVVYYNWM